MSKNHVNNFRGEIYFTPNGRLRIKDEPVTPIEEDFGDHNYLDNSIYDDFGYMRKSLSMNDIADLKNDQKFDDSRLHRMNRSPLGGSQQLSRTKFVSMAEAIYHYQRDTPSRFHSSKSHSFRSNNTGPSRLTIAQSPMLRSKARSRPKHVLSQKEKEDLELEELKKIKIKAHPIPKSVIEGPINLPEVPRKPVTIPEPFKLTEVSKIVQSLTDKVQAFKARPAPKHILEKPQIPCKVPIQVNKVVSPKLLRNPKPVVTHNPQPKKILQNHGPLKVEPFSFEKRDEAQKRRKEERIKRQIEEERKLASQFKAQPLPGVVKKQMHCATAKGNSSTTSSENKENNYKFEARPPTVLFKEPFKPVLQHLHSVKLAPFQLTTQKRAAEREIFDKMLKEKEEEQERLRKQKEYELKESEEKVNAELRSKLVHHPKPVPTLPPFVPEKSLIPITMPETPKFVRRLNNKKC